MDKNFQSFQKVISLLIFWSVFLQNPIIMITALPAEVIEINKLAACESDCTKSHITFDDKFVNDFLIDFVERMAQEDPSTIPDSLMHCYMRLKNGECDLHTQDARESVDFVLNTLTRAVRPGSGCCGGDGQIISLLQAIACRIDTCCRTLEQDFAFTWTILDNLQVNFTGTAIINVDNSGIFTALESCCNTLEQDFAFTWTILANLACTSTAAINVDNSGVFTALEACCSTLEQDFAFTWTILDNLACTFTSAINVDNSGVFTALEACCNTLEQDFAFTWTILANLACTSTAAVNVDNSGVFTALEACCSTLEQDFAFTWTILAGLQDSIESITANINLNITVTIDNSGVFTSLAEIQSTLTQCCSTLEQDFAFTWTILNNLQVNFSGTAIVDNSGVFTALDACCSTLEQDFAFTWTILDSLASTLTAQINVDNSGIFTALADIQATLTDCCSTLEQDFAFTWTILAELQDSIESITANINLNITVTVDTAGIFTVLEEIQTTLTDCCATLEQDFAFTWTILDSLASTLTAQLNIDNSGIFTALADIQTTLTDCCSTLEQDFAFTWTILAELQDSIESITANINLNITVTVDTAGIFTVLEEIQTTLTDCCAILEQDFAFTWTILGDLETTLTFTNGPAPNFPNLGDSTENRLNAINEQVNSLIDWVKMNYAMLRSLHNNLLGTGENISILFTEM